MSLWIILVVVGQFLNALVSLVDKYVVTSATVVLRPLAYTFWISVLSAGSVIIYCFSWIPVPIEGLDIPSFARIHAPSLLVAALSITAGYAFFTSLLSLFTALKDNDASDVVPVVGGLTALFTLLLSYAFLGTKLSQNFFYGFTLLTLGTLLVSRFRFTFRTMLSTVHAGLMFGVHYVALKGLFNATNFDTAFFWSRMAIVFVALSMLLVPDYYEKIVSRTKASHAREGMIVIGNKLLAGLASIILLKAIEHGDVSLVQALGGLQYLFLLIISAVFGRMISQDFGENVAVRDVLHKLVSIPLIAAGFFFLFL
jgi:uncharacterized membrane protein